MIRSFLLWAAALAAGLIALLMGADEAAARPGGGHSYSGGSSGSGGGGDGGGALVHLLIRLIIYKPQLGVPVAVVVVVAVVVAKRRNDGLSDWDSGESVAAPRAAASFEDIKRIDPDFSSVLFTDFAYALYAACHRARHTDEGMRGLSPYLSEPSTLSLRQRMPQDEPVTAVIIGSMRVMRISVPLAPQADGDIPDPIQIWLQFESNLTIGGPGNERTHFTTEAWMLTRDATVQSKPPDKTKVLGCPNCGAPFASTDDATCEYCGEVVGGGRFDWCVESVQLFGDEVRPPKLVGHAPERGTRLATVHHPDFQRRFASLVSADPSVTHESLFARIQVIFAELGAAWTARDLSSARALLSEGMTDYLGYWLDAYRQQGLQNVTEDAEITGWDVCRVDRDRFYDSIVVRLFAKSTDYTVDVQSDSVVGGSKTKLREYSEYWTLIRGATVRGSPSSDPKACPNCGAETSIGMGGHCGHCGVHVSSGEFDWVLSKIEQDEAYRG